MIASMSSTESLWEQFSDKLRGFLRTKVSDPETAEDLLQEVFLRIHKHIDEIRDEERLTSWVYQIARNLVTDYYRKKGKAPVSGLPMEELADESRPSEGGDTSRVVANWLAGMISELPDPYAEAVELYEMRGLSQQQIADKMGISLSGAKSRIQRGREKLKGILDDCCTLKLDSYGTVVDFDQKYGGDDCCKGCDDSCD